MKDLYLALCTQLQSGQNNPLKWIDFDLSQLEAPHPPVAFPCALISFPDSLTIESAPATGQAAEEVTVQIRLAFRVIDRTTAQAPTPERDTALAHLDALDYIFRRLQHFSGNTFTKLRRNRYAQEPPSRPDIRTYTITFNTRYAAYITPDTTPTYTPWSQLQPPHNTAPTLDVQTDLITNT